jgi:hypothetical protein
MCVVHLANENSTLQNRTAVFQDDKTQLQHLQTVSLAHQVHFLVDGGYDGVEERNLTRYFPGTAPRHRTRQR